jgi:hypothetical protein
MEKDRSVDTLRRHQDAALRVLAQGSAVLAQGQAALLDQSAGLRQELMQVLAAYQSFKHDVIFDPAIASGNAERAALAREMKVHCIAAGEVFRGHMMQWTPARIAGDWASYKVAARLTISQLHRHILAERAGIAELLNRYGDREAA